MIKTVIRYSWVYNNFLNSGKYSYKEHEKFKKSNKKFEKLYKKNISKIISLIEKCTKNRKWGYRFIPIYIVKNKIIKMRSFSDPLTLKALEDNGKKRDTKAMLIVLIHELIHNNLPHKEQIRRGYSKNEEFVNEITKKVCNDLNIDLKNGPIKALRK